MQISSPTVAIVFIATRESLKMEGVFSTVEAAATAVDTILDAEDSDYDTVYSTDTAPEWAPQAFQSTFQDDDEAAFHTASGKLIWVAVAPVQG